MGIVSDDGGMLIFNPGNGSISGYVDGFNNGDYSYLWYRPKGQSNIHRWNYEGSVSYK